MISIKSIEICIVCNACNTLLLYPQKSLTFSDSKGQFGVLFAAAKTRMLLEACMRQVVLHLHHQITANTRNHREAATWQCIHSSVYMAAYTWKRVNMHAQMVEIFASVVAIFAGL